MHNLNFIDRAMIQSRFRALNCRQFDVWQQYTMGLVLRSVFAFIFLCVFFAAFFGIFYNRLVLQSLDDLFARLYGSAAMGATDEQDTQSLLADLAAFQDRMRLHIDEQARLAALGAGASFLAHDIRNLLASLQLKCRAINAIARRKRTTYRPKVGHCH